MNCPKMKKGGGMRALFREEKKRKLEDENWEEKKRHF
jgi:hypothetical protein